MIADNYVSPFPVQTEAQSANRAAYKIRASGSKAYDFSSELRPNDRESIRAVRHSNRV
jgi:hypothetical protein